MDSVDKYGSGGVPWWRGKEANLVSMEHQVNELNHQLNNALQPVIDALVPAVQCLVDALVPMVDESVKNLSLFWDAILKSYPDKRVVHLAFHHPKERVRKKNRNRIIKWISKGVSNDDRNWTKGKI